jgi:hypothetical protein
VSLASHNTVIVRDERLMIASSNFVWSACMLTLLRSAVVYICVLMLYAEYLEHKLE